MSNHVTAQFAANINGADSLRIVVATDLRERSAMALRRAIALATGIDARLSLVHAVRKAPSKSKERARRNFAYAQLLSAVDEAISSPIDPHRQSFNHIEIDVQVGKPLDVIIAAANEVNADLIVIAAPQARRLDWIVGTTAERLIRATQRPVLIVHGEMHAMYRSAAVATDLSDGSISLIQAAARFGLLAQAHTTLLHAFDRSYAGTLKSAGVEAGVINSFYRDWRDELEAKARGALDAAGVAIDNSRVVVQPNEPAAAIREIIEQRQPELLVIGASRWFLTKRLLIGSVADEVLRTARCDILVIPRKLKKAYMSRMRHAAPKSTTPFMDEAPQSGHLPISAQISKSQGSETPKP